MPTIAPRASGIATVASTTPAPGRANAPTRVAAATPTPRVEVWDMSSGIEQPVEGAALLRRDDPAIGAAYANAAKVDAFMRDTLGRDGWDGLGSPVRIVVHAPNEDGSPAMNNAYWDNSTKRIYLGDGDGQLFTPLGGALDVMMHEATHAIVDAEVKLRYEGQQGGINESWADVMASLADPDWRIGEDVFTPDTPRDEIRDLRTPRFGHVDDLPPGVALEPHDYSGIPSLAAVRVADHIGRDQMGRIWYSALVDHLGSRAGYAAAARATLDAATQLHGAASDTVQTVLDAWKSVGVDPRWNRPD